MFKNYLKASLRSLTNNRWTAFISILGLTLGITTFLLIFLHVYDELSYDRFHRNADQIHRLALEYTHDETAQAITLTSAPMGPALAESFPEVLTSVRFRKVYRGFPSVRNGDINFYEEQFFATDSTFFDVFDFPLIKGDPNTALNDPFSIVITEEMAQKYFGNEDPIQRTLIVNGKDQYQVTGVLKNFPSYSHLRFFDFLVSFSTLPKVSANMGLDNWEGLFVRTYVLLDRGASAEQLESKLPPFVEKNIGENLKASGTAYRLFFQPIADIHLKSNLVYEFVPGGSVQRLKVLGSIGILVLLLSCFNYISLATARSSLRTQEIGMRKIMGAQRHQLIFQFLSESATFTLLSIVLSLIAVWLLLPQLNTVLDKSLTLDRMGLLFGSSIVVVTFFSVTILAGLYPALLIAAQQPLRMVQKRGMKTVYNIKLRHLLAGFQLMISSALIIGSIAIFKQIEFLKNKNLGFNKEHVIVIPCQGSTTKNFRTIKTKLLENASVKSVTFASATLGESLAQTQVIPEGMDPGKEGFTWYTMNVDENFVETLGLQVVKGRSFSEDFASDTLGEAFMINEAALQQLQWKDPNGKKAAVGPKENAYLIGVLSDFNFASLHQKVEPLVIRMHPASYRTVSLKVNFGAGNMQQTLDEVKASWRQAMPDAPFDYTFLDEKIQKLYQSEKQFATLANFLTVLALFISGIGLFALASFIIRRQYKQIAIRKVLGASLQSILYLLSREFFIITMIALMFSVPMVFYLINKWAEEFAYRTDFGPEIFIWGSMLTLLIPLVSIGMQSFRAASHNPVKTLREE